MITTEALAVMLSYAQQRARREGERLAREETRIPAAPPEQIEQTEQAMLKWDHAYQVLRGEFEERIAATVAELCPYKGD